MRERSEVDLLSDDTVGAARAPIHRAFGLEFRLSGSASVAIGELGRLLEPMRSEPTGGEERRVRCSSNIVIDQQRSNGQLFYRLTIDGTWALDTREGGVLMHRVLWEITQRAVETRPDSLILHAGCVLVDDTMVIVCGRSGSGKSTLVAALAQAGGTFLTDEALEIDPNGQPVDALARPVQLDQRSRDVLATPLPQEFGRQDDGNGYFHFMGDVRLPSPADRTIVATLESVEGTLHTATRSRARTIASLMTNSFGEGRRSQSGLSSALALVRRSSCVEMSGGTLRERVYTLRQISELS